MNKFWYLYKADRNQDKRLFLTFDDGPNPYVTMQILELLDAFKIKAAFFMVGSNMHRFPDIVREIERRGHLIGNHSFSHPMFFALRSENFQRADVQKVENELNSMNMGRCTYFRPPQAFCSVNTLQALSGKYIIVGVNHYIGDHAIFVVNRVVAGILNSIKKRGGGIIVLHDGVHPLIARSRAILLHALKKVIPILLSQGYQFYRLDEIKSSSVIIDIRNQ